MIKDDIAQLIGAAIQQAIASEALPPLGQPEITLERPTNPQQGDYSSNIALRLKRVIPDNSPIRIAEIIRQHLASAPFIEAVEIVPPGSLNFRLSHDFLTSQVQEVLAAGPAYGQIGLGSEHRVLVEFVSANPTGPLTLGWTRCAVLGDVLANILTAAGYEVEREYLVNDVASRMELFYANVWYFYQKLLGRDSTLPLQLNPAAEFAAQQIYAQDGDKYAELSDKEALTTVGPLGVQAMVAAARTDLDALGVKFDTWFSEQSLFDSGAVADTLNYLNTHGYVTEREGATWFVSSTLGQEKDNVLIRSSGQPTYFVSDIAYHRNKLAERNFDMAIDVWTSDHQGHAPRMKAAVAACGLNADQLHIIIMQLVTLVGQPASPGLTLHALLQQLSPAAIRFHLLSHNADSKIELDLELAAKATYDNPLYFVQSAYAQCAALLDAAAEQGLSDWQAADLTKLTDPAELALIRTLTQLPEVVESAARTFEPHRLPRYAQTLAAQLQAYSHEASVLDTDNVALSRARLKLIAAVQQVLANTLALLGINPSDKAE